MAIEMSMEPSLRMRLSDSLHAIARMLLRRAPLTAPAEALSCNPFFIIGSGRSGNTLLRAMLVAHPDLSIPPESFVLPAVIRKFYRYDYILWPDLAWMVITEFETYPEFRFWELDTRELYERALALPEKERSLAKLLDLIYVAYEEKHQPGAKRWGDKTPMNTLCLERLNWVYPNAQYIHIIRDGRDVAASYLAAGIFPDLKSACARWVTSIERAQEFGKRVGPERYCEVRYEGLVRNPAPCLQNLSAFLEVTYSEIMLDFWKVSDQLGDTQQKHHTNLKNPVNPKSIGRWREKFDGDTQGQMDQWLRGKLRELGYVTG